MGPIFDFGDPVLDRLMKEHGGKLFSEAKPDLLKRICEMAETMVDFLEGRGIVVHRPRQHTEDEWANFAPLRAALVTPEQPTAAK